MCCQSSSRAMSHVSAGFGGLIPHICVHPQSPHPLLPFPHTHMRHAPSYFRPITSTLAGAVAHCCGCWPLTPADQNVHPIMPMLHPYTPRRMLRVLGASFSAGAFFFWLLAFASALAFGPGLQVNVLSNMSAQSMAPLVGPAAAFAMNLLVRGGFLVSLLGSFLLFMYPLRTSAAEVVADVASARQPPARGGSSAHEPLLLPAASGGGGGGGDAAGAAGGGVDAAAVVERFFNALTFVLLLAVVACAVLVPNIWQALSLIGNVASTVEAFIVPGIIVLALYSAQRRLRRRRGGPGCGGGPCDDDQGVEGGGSGGVCHDDGTVGGVQWRVGWLDAALAGFVVLLGVGLSCIHFL